MALRLSLASLVDQNDSAIQILRTIPINNLTTLFNLTQSTIPQIFLVNPAQDNLFLHIDTQSAHAAIIGIIYFSMWMGALGWDIVSTIFFDLRVIRETTWSSLFSAIYSIAYLLSRYGSLACLITTVTNSVIMTEACDYWIKISTSLFSIAISATMLVFCLRTCSIWHMKPGVVYLEVGAWLVVTSFAVLLPIMSYGSQLPTSNFCSWHLNGLYVVGVFVTLLLFDVLCLVLTVLKLNKTGWQGIMKGILPSTDHSIDSEDVKTMLVQKTTAFIVIQFCFLITALLEYLLTDQYAYRMMNLIASVAVASSMAGRIFRKAWRQTRELTYVNINKPPSYTHAWAKQHQRRQCFGESPTTPLSSTSILAASPLASRYKRQHADSLDLYVEGEFGPKHISSAVSLRSASSKMNQHKTDAAQRFSNPSALEAGHLEPTPEMTQIRRCARNELPNGATTSSHLNPHQPAVEAGEGGLFKHKKIKLASQSWTELSPGRFALGAESEGSGHRLATGDSQRSSFTAGKAFSFSSKPISFGDGQLAYGSTRFTWDRRPSAISLQTPAALEDHHRSEESSAQKETGMEEKRRVYIASPPISAGARLDSKQESRKVYDVESVKAAAQLAQLSPTRTRLTSIRPSTTSSINQTSRWMGLTESSLAASSLETRFATGIMAPLFSNRQSTGSFCGQLTTRPKTAPVVSPLSSSTGLWNSAGPKGMAADDALFAFRQTVEEDARQQNNEEDLATGTFASACQTVKGDSSPQVRPRTSRGAGLSAYWVQTWREGGTIVDDGGGGGGDHSLGLQDRPRTATTRRPLRCIGSSSGRRSTLSTFGDDDGRTQINQPRPSTSAGEDVKPFGSTGLCDANQPDLSLSSSSLPVTFSSQQPSRHRIAKSEEEEEEEDRHETAAQPKQPLGSVIQRQYAKLLAAADVSLDPPDSVSSDTSEKKH